MNTKSKLLKSIFISLILVMGVANMSAATITSDGTARLYFNMSAVSWWIAGTDGNGNFGYFFNNSTGKNAWSAHSVKHDGNTYYVVIPAGTWAGVILTRNNTSTSPSWNNKWNQTGDITLSSTSNYISKFSEGSTSVTWGTAIKPASTGSLSASSTSVNIGANVTLTPSLTSNQTINDIQSTSYSISPNSGASISGNTFTATKAGTYTVTATITYNPDGYTSLTSTVSPTVTIKVNPWTITWNPNGGSVTPTSSTYDGATAVSLPTPTRTGYNFDGWYTAASGGTKINDIGTTTKPTSNVTYYAHWTPKTYTITLDKNGGASNGSATATYNSNTVAIASQPTRTDYRCDGYATAASGGTLVLNTNGTLVANVSGYTDANGNWIKDGTATLHAQWTYDVTEYTVTFGVGTGYTSYGSLSAKNNSTSASITSPATVRSGQSITFTANPKPGYVVEGWYTNAACTAGKHNAGNTTYTTSITGATNVYVKFVENTWSVSFAATTGGTVDPSATQIVGEANGITIIAESAKGYTFAGWTSSNGGSFNDAKAEKTTFYPTAATTVTANFTENLYTITVKSSNKDHGTVTPSTGEAGIATYITITATQEDGYRFVNWTATNGITIANDESTTTTITASAAGTVTANFELIPPTIVYLNPNSNWKQANARFAVYCWNSSGNEWFDMTKIDCNGDYYVVEIPVAYKDFKFVRLNPATTENNWNDGTKWNETGDLKVPTGDEVLFSISNWGDGSWGEFTAPTYTITLDRQDGTTESTSVTATYGSDAPSITTPTRANYTFEGYYTQQNGQGDLYIDKNGAWQNIEYIADGKWMKPACNLTLYAKWTISAAQYTVTLNAQEGEGGSPSVQAYVGFAMPEITLPTRTGYTFNGYFTATSGGTKYYNADGSSAKNWDKTVATTLYAQWTANKYTVTFHANGGEGSMEEQEFTYDIEQALTANAFIRTSYTFTGWNTNANGSGTAYNDGQSVQNLTDVDNGTINLYAQWEEILSTITIIVSEGGSVKVDGEDFESGHTVQVGVATTKQVTAVPHEGYGVEAWGVSNKDIVNISGANTVTLKSDGSGSTGTLYANFIGLEYTITFDKQEGTEGTDKATVRYKKNNYSVSQVEAPTRTGYTFGGYYTQAAGAGVQVVSAEGQWLANATDYTDTDIKWLVKENTTLYAKWTANKYTVTFNGNGATGGSTSEQGFTYDQAQNLNANGFRYGSNVFLGWSKEAKGTVEYTDQQSVSNLTDENNGEVVLYAIWATPKTIYLKTVEGTKDGVEWYVRYNSTETLMDSLGCTGEYYTAEVPEQTEFQLIAKDKNGDVIAKETRDELVVPDNSNMFNLVAAGASGDKIFFKPNSHWKNHSTHKYFVARFWTGSAVIKDLIDNDGDGIYECEKPAGAIEVYFCLTKAQASASSGKDWPSDDVAHTNDNVKEGFKDGKNLFTLGDDQTVGGENDNGTWSTHADTPVNGEGNWTIFEGATYRITFNHEGAESGTTTPGVAYVDAQHNSAMPTIESLPKNTDWKFAGYHTAAVGGTAITNAFGDWLDADGYISDGKWAKEACVTLYAHWVEKTPEITVVTLDKEAFDAGTAETVTATPTVQEYPSYTGDSTICWKMLDNSGIVMESFPFTPGDNNSVTFSTDGLTTGKYTVRASIYDTDCDTGNELSRYDKTFIIVSGYKVTVKYLCDGEVIQASTIAEGHASTPTSITAPEIGGYKFVEWELGEGISSESDLKSETIEYTAIYDGYLTAKYEKRKLIFLDLSTLPNKANWTAPHIYLYKGAKDEQTGGYWNDQDGAGGAKGGNYITHAAMTPVPNTENIWYFDYEQYTNNFNVFVAFTSNDQKNATHFANCEAIYRTEFSSGTPVFVPESGQTAETKNSNAKYYSKGYWVKYMGGTGYWLIIYNAEGNKELVRREFTSATQRMTMTSIVDLEAEHTYQYEIYRNDGYYYKGGDITYTNSSDYRPLNEANKHSIKTTETGDYTFTLDYFTGDLQIKVQYPGEVGDYRILYTDDVRDGRYKPSQIISQNNKEPLVSFFIRPNDNPELKIQKATFVTENEVKWDYNNFIYLKPNSNWKIADARFAAAFLNGDKTQTVWVSMTSIEGNTTYGCAIPNGTWKYVIFCRMNGNTTENNWDNKWDQTNDLDIPTNGNNLYTIANNAWSNGDGSWSKFTNNNSNIIDLSTALKEKLSELDLRNIKAKEGSVFNIHLSNNEGTLTIEKVAFYTGNYYIRVDAVDGKWYDYKTNPDNLMTYSAFSESDANSFGEKFSHYKTKWCSREKGDMNVKFVIANDYSLCISDTLTQDEGNPFGNIDEHGNITNTNDGKYDANIRFMWNRHTNKVSRAYVAGASGDNTRFLVLKAGQTIQNESGQAINNNEVVFKDTQNWLYERTIKVQPGTLVKLIAYYPDGNKAQYFRGTSANGFEENVSAVQILGGNSEEWYTMRLIYDFKTNRLMAAWVPDQNINGTLAIDADIMVIRQHQEDATCITFASSQSALTEVKTVYGVMRFNRWILNNRSTSTHNALPLKEQKTIYERALYFISFPFDVHLSDVFGFGTYGTHWVISTYNGERRAKNGYFVDNCMNEDCTNWDYIWDPDDFTMKANQGYLLSLDLDLMKHDNTSFWEHDIQQVELFFPSYAPVQTIQQTEYTMPALGEEYQCTINFNNANPGETGYNPANDHRVRDSYWRCIGVPSFADYDGSLYQSKEDAQKKEPFTWKPKGNDFPFLYEWNVSDNSLMVRAASKYNFRSTFAYLVQNGNSIFWSAVNTKPASIVAKQQGESNNYEWKITLTRNEQVEDQAFVRLSNDEKITNNFDFGQDLSKEFNYGRSDIYTLIGYEKAAANSLPISEQTTVIPLGLSIEYNGDYTLAMPDRVNGIGVTLVDNQTGTRTNLSAGMDYTLTLNKGDYNNRFFIEISPIQQTPTDIEYVTGDTNGKETVRKVLIDNILYIVRDGQMFDARGARVK